ncbi:MAG: metal-dependent phosphohydrolase [Pirellula sp.]|nr:metal-dependent phosphohydrolase [Pirellula sp.]
MKQETPQRRFAFEVVERLRSAGFAAYWAGGCVRDELLGITPKDYDVATSARPEQVRELFGRRQTLAVGEAFGVIIVVGSREAGNVEVATFRRDAGYSDGRRPDAVVFTDAEEDARRRDFTMNALFYDPVAGEVIDFVAGRADIERKLVRAVGDASLRFQEDKLRMLRGVRMASTFGFELEAATFAAIQKSAGEIGVVSPERIAQEVRAMFGRPGQAEAARLLMAAGLAGEILPEVLPLRERRSSLAAGSAWEAAVAMLAEFEQAGIRKPPLALAALLQETSADDSHDSVHTATAVLRRWRMSNEEREQVEWLLEHRRRLDRAATRRWSEVQPALAHRWGPDLVEFAAARNAIAADGATQRRAADIAFAREKLAEPRAVLDPPPLLTGNDLVRRGLRPGRQFAVLLEKVRAAQLDGVIASVDEAATLVAELLKAGP